MKKKQVHLRPRRLFTEDFKRSLIKEYESGKFSILELGNLHQIKVSLIYRWIYKYSIYNKKKVMVVEYEDSSMKRLKEMELRIKELERIVGQKQIKIDYLEKMIEIAGEQYNIDVKKNFDTPHSNGSNHIEE